MSNTVIVNSESNEVIVLAEDQPIDVVTVITEGPMGPAGDQGVHLAHLTDVDVSDVADKSVIFYDANTSLFRANQDWTIGTLTDGGNW